MAATQGPRKAEKSHDRALGRLLVGTYARREHSVANPFDDDNGTYHVLINGDNEHSLWPSFMAVPQGWTIIHHAQSRADCLAFINKHWTHMGPKLACHDTGPSVGGER
jgi:uncharacterized protein YbdZ (MbtH family)